MEIRRETRSYDPLFPFTLLYMMIGEPDQKVNFHHFHDWYEIVYVHKGTGSFLIDKQFYSMKKGDLYVIPGDIIHHPNPSAVEPYVCSVLLFHPHMIHSSVLGDEVSYLAPFEQTIRDSRHCLLLTENEQKEAEKIFMEMNKEAASGQAGSRHAQLLHLHWILLMISRRPKEVARQQRAHHHSKSELWMKEILLYIDDHLLDGNLNLGTLSKHALVSQEHFSRVFKKVTGVSLPSYIGMKRLYRAKNLLLNSDYPISYISDYCGFKSPSYFHHKFREEIGTTPGDYRKRNQNK